MLTRQHLLRTRTFFLKTSVEVSHAGNNINTRMRSHTQSICSSHQVPQSCPLWPFIYTQDLISHPASRLFVGSFRLFQSTTILHIFCSSFLIGFKGFTSMFLHNLDSLDSFLKIQFRLRVLGWRCFKIIDHDAPLGREVHLPSSCLACVLLRAMASSSSGVGAGWRVSGGTPGLRPQLPFPPSRSPSRPLSVTVTMSPRELLPAPPASRPSPRLRPRAFPLSAKTLTMPVSHRPSVNQR